jgi:hypothetical protein
MANEIEQSDQDSINNITTTRTNTGDTTLVNDSSESINSTSLYQGGEANLLDRSNIFSYSDLGFHYRSNSPLSNIRSNSPTSSNLELNLNLQNDID